MNLLIWFLVILFNEILFVSLNGLSFNGFFLKIILSFTSASFISLLFNFKNKKVNKVLWSFILVIIELIYIVQFIYYGIFESLLSVRMLGNSGQVTKFTSSVLNILYDNILELFLFLCPVILFFIFYRSFVIKKNSKKMNYTLLGSFCLSYLVSILFIWNFSTGIYSLKNLYFNINSNNENMKSFGILTSVRLDLQRSLFGFDEIKLIEYKDSSNDDFDKDKYNVLDIDFDKIIIDNDNEEVVEISKYLKIQSPSKKNEYTGIFKDKNLIFIMGESFSSMSVDKELTSTLYKLCNEGFKFNNYYTPLFPVSTADGEYMLDTGILPVEGVWSIEEVGNNLFPYTYGNAFKSVGYKSYFFHNYDYNYYERDNYVKTMGFDQYLANGNGLEKFMDFSTYPSSDYEMINSTFDIYSSDDKFLAYYVTMSGHRDYTMSHDIVKKNWDKVKDLDYSLKAKAYLATQIELDMALELLLSKLEEKGILQDTVIVMSGDHYPYGLNKNEILELSGNMNDYYFERFHAPLIIYNSEVNGETSKYAFSMDVLPTVLNLFGIEFDSRLLMGRDIFSDSENLVIFSDHSFITEKGKYYSDIGRFISFTNNSVDKKYVDNIKKDIYSKYRISRLILENNYYEYLFE